MKTESAASQEAIEQFSYETRSWGKMLAVGMEKRGQRNGLEGGAEAGDKRASRGQDS